MWKVVQTLNCGREGFFGPFETHALAIDFVATTQMPDTEVNLKSLTIERTNTKD